MSEQAERGLSVEDFDDLEGEQREQLDGDEHSLDDRGDGESDARNEGATDDGPVLDCLELRQDVQSEEMFSGTSVRCNIQADSLTHR